MSLASKYLSRFPFLSEAYDQIEAIHLKSVLDFDFFFFFVSAELRLGSDD